MTTETQSFNAQHTDLIHDVKFDYYGKRLATCSSDTTIRIFEVSSDRQQLIKALKGHEGPVWSVDWSHPKFGTFLASCGYDHRIIIWEERGNQWVRVYTYTCDASVNSVSWAPPEIGLCLACASSDCSILIVTFDVRNKKWVHHKIPNAHQIGCTSISWCSGVSGGLKKRKTTTTTTTSDEEESNNNNTLEASPSFKRFVSGGCDHKVIIWGLREGPEGGQEWVREDELVGHRDWVRSVAWAPNIGLPCETVASCGQDKIVCIWKKKDIEKDNEDNEDNEESINCWKKKVIQCENIVWKVSWSITGNILAVTTADNLVKMYREDLSNGEWLEIGEIKEKKDQDEEEDQ